MTKQHRNPFHKIVANGPNSVINAKFALVKTFYLLQFKVLGTNVPEWNARMDNWISRRFPDAFSRAKCMERGNVSRNLAKDRITWAMFMKGVDILGYTKVYIKFVFIKLGSENTSAYTINNQYKALINGNDFNRGDILIHGITCNFGETSSLYETWYNTTKRKMIEAPATLRGLKDLKDSQDIEMVINDVADEYSRDINDVEDAID